MVRTLKIDIWDDDWYIEADEIKDNKKLEECKHIWFANFEIYDSKITYLYDYMIDEKKIKEAQKGKEFAEVCEFVYVPREKGELTESKKESFTGDFIDALIFIEHKLKAKNGKDKKAS
jgi:hypothetical protein